MLTKAYTVNKITANYLLDKYDIISFSMLQRSKEIMI